MSDPKLWAEPPKLRGAYEGCDYAAPGKIGPREAGSIFANVAMIQAITIPIAYEIEAMAAKAYPGLPFGVAGASAWFGQTVAYLVLKISAQLLRNYGASFARDFGAWVWLRWIGPLFSAAASLLWGNAPLPGKPAQPGIFKRLFGLRRKRRRVRR